MRLVSGVAETLVPRISGSCSRPCNLSNTSPTSVERLPVALPGR